MTSLSCIGVVVHPTRDVSEPLAAITAWASRAEIGIVQVPVWGQQREVAQFGTVEQCELIVAIGGDGTTLAAIRVAVPAHRPVIGVACGSLGVLTAIAADRVDGALTEFCGDQWTPLALPALQLSIGEGGATGGGRTTFALNDISIVRAGEGQVRTTAQVDGAVFARFAGDGCIVSTPIGSSAYALSAGGPLLMPGTDGFLLTPLTVHGGSCPPLVLGAGAALELQIVTGYGGARLEVDGQVDGAQPGLLAVSFRPGVATLATFADREPFLAGLRRRGIISDSPRILAEDARGWGPAAP
jgi:NAD+ kinase